MLLLQLPPFMENAAECVKTAMGDRHLSDPSSLSPGEPFRVESSAGELRGALHGHHVLIKGSQFHPVSISKRRHKPVA